MDNELIVDSRLDGMLKNHKQIVSISIIMKHTYLYILRLQETVSVRPLLPTLMTTVTRPHLC